MHTLQVATKGRAFHDLTSEVAAQVKAAKISEGLATVHLQHTSASLVIQENADPGVRRDLERFMARICPDGDPMLEIAETHRIDLLVTDVVMPGGSGPKLMERMTLLHESLRVLFISGYVNDAFSHDKMPVDRTRLLEKPFTGARLLQFVRAILDGAEPDDVGQKLETRADAAPRHSKPDRVSSG